MAIVTTNNKKANILLSNSSYGLDSTVTMPPSISNALFASPNDDDTIIDTQRLVGKNPTIDDYSSLDHYLVRVDSNEDRDRDVELIERGSGVI